MRSTVCLHLLVGNAWAVVVVVPDNEMGDATAAHTTMIPQQVNNYDDGVTTSKMPMSDLAPWPGGARRQLDERAVLPTNMAYFDDWWDDWVRAHCSLTTHCDVFRETSYPFTSTNPGPPIKVDPFCHVDTPPQCPDGALYVVAPRHGVCVQACACPPGFIWFLGVHDPGVSTGCVAELPLGSNNLICPAHAHLISYSVVSPMNTSTYLSFSMRQGYDQPGGNPVPVPAEVHECLCDPGYSAEDGLCQIPCGSYADHMHHDANGSCVCISGYNKLFQTDRNGAKVGGDCAPINCDTNKLQHLPYNGAEILPPYAEMIDGACVCVAHSHIDGGGLYCTCDEGYMGNDDGACDPAWHFDALFCVIAASICCTIGIPVYLDQSRQPHPNALKCLDALVIIANVAMAAFTNVGFAFMTLCLSIVYLYWRSKLQKKWQAGRYPRPSRQPNMVTNPLGPNETYGRGPQPLTNSSSSTRPSPQRSYVPPLPQVSNPVAAAQPDAATTLQIQVLGRGGGDLGAGLITSTPAAASTPLATQMFQTQCPLGASPGDTVPVVVDGAQMMVIVPPGINVGQTFMVQMPLATSKPSLTVAHPT